MKKKYQLPFFIMLTIVLTISISCQKSVEAPKDEPVVKNESSPEWGANDEKYVASLRNFRSSLSGRLNTLCTSGGDSTYGWFSDPDSVLIEGPYSIAKVGSYESDAETCTALFTLAEDAEEYLTNEGYPDIVNMYTYRHHYVVQAANALLELKEQMIIDWEDRNPSGKQAIAGRQSGVANCLFQALGYATLAEIGANWATMSRQQIIKRVGKIILKHVGVIGSIIAIASFIDCMWG